MSQIRRRLHPFPLLLAVAVAVVAAAIALLSAGSSPNLPETAGPGATRFAELSSATSNRCDLGAAELRSMPDGAHLQGACCSPMDRDQYRRQLRAIHRLYRSALVAPDPYDVSVALAKRLLGYRGIPLDAAQRATYRRARHLAETGGPCCCPCWRWQAFMGQARFLIARRDYRGEQVAHLWELEQGCGGDQQSA